MEDIKKKRTLNLDQDLNKANGEAIRNELLNTNGIQVAEFKTNRWLHVEYDLIRIDLIGIEKILNDKCCILSQGVLAKFFRSWVTFAEGNERQNMKLVPHSCCEVPNRK